MKTSLYYLSFAILICFSLTACISKSKDVLPNATGGIGEVLVVCDAQLWNAGVNKGLKQTLGKDFPMLLEREPLFNLIRIDQKGFNKLLKRSRKLLVLQKTGNDSFAEIKDKYAKPQVLFSITGKNASDINSTLLRFGSSIRQAYHQSEIDYLQKQLRNANQSDDTGLEKMGVYLEVPKDYMHIVDSTGFQWFRKNTLSGFYNLIVYESAWRGKSFIDRADIIKLRDSCVGKFVEGNLPGSHMITENRVGFEPEMKVKYHSKGPTVEMRGLWKMSGEFLGGTFLSYAYIDQKRKRLLTAEGFVFAPNRKKRNMMIQLEAILKTFRLRK